MEAWLKTNRNKSQRKIVVNQIWDRTRQKWLDTWFEEVDEDD